MRFPIRTLLVFSTLVALGPWLAARQAATDGGFSFLAGRSRTAAVTIPSAVDGVVDVAWPADAAAGWDTALLRVNITASAEGTPYLLLSAGTAVDRQYFPAGDSGEHWLNVGFAREGLAAGAPLRITSAGVVIAPGATELRLFAARPNLTRPVLVLAPHPDDAEIAAFGLYATTRSTVVTVTVGNAGAATYAAVEPDRAAQYRLKGQIRLIDSVTIPWQGGVPPERAFNLGYFDARLADMFTKPTAIVPELYGPNTDIGVYLPGNVGNLLPKRSRPSSWRNLVADIETVLRKVNPAVIAAPHPLLDTHRDHQFTTVALAEALTRWRRPATFLLYTNHADRDRYPYGPAGTNVSLPIISAPVELDRVFSLPVPADLQRRKLFALESMHDLRQTPMRQYQIVAGAGRTVHEEVDTSRADVSYYRRGPRSNELFFVYDRDTLTAMVDGFKKGRRD